MRRAPHRPACLVLAWALCAAPCLASAATPAAPAVAAESRPRIGLVLSGGGARGGAHLGVLKVLRELQVPVDVIVGTSAGAIIGAAHASGMSPDEIEAELKPLNTALLFHDVARTDLPVRRKDDDSRNFIGPEIGIGPKGLLLPTGAVAGVSLEAVLRRLTVRQRGEHFDQLPIPFRAVATDVTNAEMVVLARGSLATAVRASMALPAIVSPVELDGRLLVDGGISRNLPVDVARAMGAEVVIAVNIGTPMLQRQELKSLLSVSEQMTRFLTSKNVNQSLTELTPQDVLITPELGAVGSADFDRMLDAAAAGETAARAAAAQLQRYRISPEAYAALQSRQHAGSALPTATLAEVRIVGAQRVNPDTIRSAMQSQAGQPFDEAKADADMRRIYSTGDFERVNYHLVQRDDGGQVFTADVTEKSWGPHYLRAGLGLSSDFRGSSYFNLMLSHRLTWLNSLGGEWRNDLQIGRVDRLRSEWYQPLNTGQQTFTAVHLESRREPFDLYIQEQRISRFRREQTVLGADAGLAFAGIYELRAGVRRGRVRLGTDTGVIPGKELVPSTDVGGVAARLRADTLDSTRFPRNGVALDLNYFLSRARLGAKDEYGKVDLSLQGAVSSGPHSLRAAVYATQPTGSNDLPGYELAQLGGFLRLSGYRSGEFVGTRMRFARLVYAWRISAPGLLDGMYLGLSAEVGRINDQLGESPQRTLRSNALFLAADTPLGPVYLGYGRGASGRSATYFYLGLP
ncbi:patatin-like phospholipase family protein [Roseateles sp. LYH14W]|uniref:Patatin-like phospholipase family protein n=1 Tax=Pelomonas parva TaxID=3299032 RepID=A0ABW7F0T6_9BURK